MNRPKLRPIEVVPFRHDGQDLLLLRDPTKIARAVLGVAPASVPILRRLDGRHSPEEIQAGFERDTGSPLPRADLDAILAKLDEALLLEGDRYRAERARVEAAFRAATVREATHAGSAYPEEAEAFRELFDGHAGSPLDASDLVAVVSPHIDYRRGIETYAKAWSGVNLDRFDRAVILGTSHYGDRMWSTTDKAFATPFGRLPADSSFLEALRNRHAGDLVAGEFWHRDEHSIELNAVLLHHVAGREIPIVPVLCGSFHALVQAGESPAAAPESSGFAGALRETIEASPGRTLVVAAADLSHVGPGFGDADRLDAQALQQLERADRASMQHAAAGDAERFYRSIADEGDRRKVCGMPPIWALLSVIGKASGSLVDYRQCPHPQPGSFVSIAAMRFHRTD